MYQIYLFLFLCVQAFCLYVLSMYYVNAVSKARRGKQIC